MLSCLVCKQDSDSFLESNSADTHALCETSLKDLIVWRNFSVKGHYPLILKFSVTQVHGLEVYVKEVLLSFCTGHSHRKLWWGLFLFSTGFTSFVVLLLFPFGLPYSSLSSVFDAILSNFDEALLIDLMMHFSLKPRMSILRTGWSIQLGIMNLVKS